MWNEFYYNVCEILSVFYGDWVVEENTVKEVKSIISMEFFGDKSYKNTHGHV